MRLVSVLIPTRNRRELARLAVESALLAADAHTELVVADNSDVALELPGDERLRHLRPQGVLSMPDNWERALAAARGEWVLLLADKYMLVPGALQALRRLLVPGRDVLSYGLGQLRQGLPAEREEDPVALRQAGGELSRPSVRLRADHDSAADLRRLVASAAYPRNYPMLYTAVVRRELLVEAAARTGRFFMGSCPDVASALQVLAASQSWTATQEPLVMAQYPSGSVRWSNGAATLVGAALSRRFFDELGGTVPPVERSVAGAVFATMRAFAALRPDLGLPVEAGFVGLARQLSWELEGLPLSGCLIQHGRLCAYLQRGSLRPRAALAQLRAALAMAVPRRLRGRLPSQRAPDPLEARIAVSTSVVSSRDEALRQLAAQLEAVA